jgi:hypothetical protein
MALAIAVWDIRLSDHKRATVMFVMIVRECRMKHRREFLIDAEVVIQKPI